MKPSRIPKGEYSNRHSKKDTGGLRTVPSEQGMKLPTKVPCVECPLRRDSAPGYLGGYSPEMYLDVLHGPASLACHSSPGFHEGEIHRQNQCTGVAMYRANVGHICSVLAPDGRGIITTGAHAATQHCGHNEKDIFASPQEFYDHHKGHQRD